MSIPPSTTRFQVKDAAGRDRTLVLIQTFVGGKPVFGGQSAVSPGIKKIRTEDGAAVNRVQQGEYQIVMTGEILRSDDPAAP
jgi:hypothetical protein